MPEALTLKTEKSKQGNVLGALLALGELGKDEEAPPAAAFAHAGALQTGSETVEEALGHGAATHDDDGTEVLVAEVDEGEDDADGKDPFRDVEGDELGGLDLRGPLVEGQQLVGREHVDGVDSQRDEEGEPEVAVGERGEAGGGLEVAETLRGGGVSKLILTQDFLHVSRAAHDVFPFLLRVDPDIASAMAEETHCIEDANLAQRARLAGG